jgi:hypothetical protein
MRFLRRRPAQKEWTVVAHATGLIEAEIIAGLLRTAEIPYLIRQESVGRVLGLTIGLGMVTVLVPSQYEAEALALLDEPSLDDLPPMLDEPPLKF